MVAMRSRLLFRTLATLMSLTWLISHAHEGRAQTEVQPPLGGAAPGNDPTFSEQLSNEQVQQFIGRVQETFGEELPPSLMKSTKTFERNPFYSPNADFIVKE